MARILLFDQYQPVRDLLAEELAAEGNTVLPLGKTDLIMEEVSIFAPELIVLDLFINGEWKWDLLEEIKKLNPDLPILVLSGCYPSEDRHLSRTRGFVMKSSVFDELRQSVHKILSNLVDFGFAGVHA